MFKKNRKFCVFSKIIYLFVNIYFDSLVPTYFPILEALQKIIFCDLLQLPLRFRSWLVRQLPLGWLSFGFHVITINPWFVTSYDPLEQIWVVADRDQYLLSNVNAILFFGRNLAILVRISWRPVSCPNHWFDDWSILFSSLHQCFPFVCCWRARASDTLFVVHIFSGLGKHLVPLLNVASVQGSFTIYHSQHSECVRALNFVFHTKFEHSK